MKIIYKLIKVYLSYAVLKVKSLLIRDSEMKLTVNGHNYTAVWNENICSLFDACGRLVAKARINDDTEQVIFEGWDCPYAVDEVPDFVASYHKNVITRWLTIEEQLASWYELF